MAWFLITTITFARAAAPGCRGIDVPIDKFTKLPEHELFVNMWDGQVALPWGFHLTGGRLTLSVYAAAPGIHDEVLPSGFTLPVMMEDDSVVVLTAISETKPVPTRNYSGVATNWPVAFPLDRQTTEALGAQRITALRIATPVDTNTFNVSPAWSKQLERVLDCFGSFVTSGVPELTIPSAASSAAPN